MAHYEAAIAGVANLLKQFDDFTGEVPFDESQEYLMVQNGITLDCLALRVALANRKIRTFARMVDQLNIPAECMPQDISLDAREEAQLEKRGISISRARVSASQLYVQLARTQKCSDASLRALYRIAACEEEPVAHSAFDTISPVWNLMLCENYGAAITLVDLHYNDRAHPCNIAGMDLKITAIECLGRMDEFMAGQVGMSRDNMCVLRCNAYAIASRVIRQLAEERRANPSHRAAPAAAAMDE